MRKFFIIVTVVAIILSVVGTGVIVFIETKNQPSEAINANPPTTETVPTL